MRQFNAATCAFCEGRADSLLAKGRDGKAIKKARLSPLSYDHGGHSVQLGFSPNSFMTLWALSEVSVPPVPLTHLHPFARRQAKRTGASVIHAGEGNYLFRVGSPR